MFLIYSLLYTIVIIILILPQYLKRPKVLRKKWLNEKLGFLPATDSALWVHAVSVGEVNASVPLLRKMKSEYPRFPIILSTITDTGHKVALDKAPEGTRVVYLPFDIGFILKRCFMRSKPKVLIVIETELWPNVFRVLAKRGVPVIVLNGRLSEKSTKGYRKISFFMKEVFSFVKFFGMQSNIDAERLRKIGCEEEKVSVLGNFKFDMDMPGKIPSWALGVKAPVIVAGSTHRGEEEIVISAYSENLERFPDLKLIIAPRHPERFKEVEDLLRVKEVSFLKRSELGSQNQIPANFFHGVILLDSVGELSSVYGLADIAVIGKSFIGFGGQNPLEPAYWGKPVLCGPHMENFPFIREFFDEGAAFEIEASDLGKKIGELLDEPDRARASGEKSRALFMKNSGSVGKSMKIVGDFIGPA
jgi:3-deoxy-D-manno-octulosonic-acid transferase